MNEWKEAPLGELATHIKDGTHGTHARVESGVPFLSAKNVNNGRLVWNDNDDQISYQEFLAITSVFAPRCGDLLLTIVGTIGRSALFDGSEVAFQRSVAFVRFNDAVIPEYLFQVSCYTSFLRQLERRSNVTAQGGLYLGELAKVKIRFPGKDQQRQIAKILQVVDESIERTQALIEKHQQIKAGLMHDLFTRGIGPDGKLRPPREQAPELYQETPIGWIPKEWGYKALKEIFGSRNITNGPFGSDLLTSELKKEGVPVLYCQDVKPGFFERISSSNVTHQKATQLSFCNVRKGDILLAKVGTPPCDSCVYPEGEPAVVTQDVIRIRTAGQSVSGFFSNWFNTGNGRKAIRKISIEGTRERVSLGEFKELCLPVPKFDEQYEIESRIQTLQVFLANSYKDWHKLKKQKSGLMHDLLTGKVPVTVDADTPELAHV